MILQIVKNIIVSIIIITFFHYLYKFLINELTIKKTNNILHEEIYEYKNINNILNKENEKKDKKIETNKNIEDKNLKINLEKELEESLKEYYKEINNIKD